MSRKHYRQLAEIVGQTFATQTTRNGRETIYQTLYLPLTEMLKQDNPNFSFLRFSEATGLAETAARKENG